MKELNYGDFPFDPRDLTHLLLTHAHIDHSGLIPKLGKKGFQGVVWATPATLQLCGALLPDSGHIQEMEVERKNRKGRRAGREALEAIYTAAEAEECLRRFRPVAYEQELDLGGGVRVTFHDAGHILGSAMLELTWAEEGEGGVQTILFSGDIGNLNRPIVNNPYQPRRADYLVMESTYGDRVREDRGDEVSQLAEVISDTFRRGGNLIIPAFAVERTQDLLYDLGKVFAAGAVQPAAVYIDSPLAVKATEIFCQNVADFDEETRASQPDQESCPLYIPGLRYSQTTEESMALNRVKGGAIIISASGMCDAGRIKHHLKHNLWRAECTVLFVGYQAEGTLGRQLLDGAERVRIHGEEILVRARIASIEGFSSHADLNGLLAWASGYEAAPRQVFITHGESAASQHLAALVQEKFGWPATAPERLAAAELRPGQARLLPAAAERAAGPDLAEQARLFQAELAGHLANRAQGQAAGPGALEAVLRRWREELAALVSRRS